MVEIESKIVSYREDTDDYRLCLTREEIEEIKKSMTNDAIVSQLLEMNGGVGFDTEDLFAAMNDMLLTEKQVAEVRADAIDEFVEYVKQYMWWSTESDEKVIGEFALNEYAIAFKNKLKEQNR